MIIRIITASFWPRYLNTESFETFERAQRLKIMKCQAFVTCRMTVVHQLGKYSNYINNECEINKMHAQSLRAVLV